jgi:hypothetical protein
MVLQMTTPPQLSWGGAMSTGQENRRFAMTNSSASVTFRPFAINGVRPPYEHLQFKTVDNLAELVTTFNSFSMMGNAGITLWGVAFLQGGRLAFTTAMPITQLLNVARSDREERTKRQTVTQAMTRMNRPREAGHAKALREYLLANACQGQKWIVPAFTLNFGDKDSTPEDAPPAIMVAFANALADPEYMNGWPAMVFLPNAYHLQITDGAHRQGELADLIGSNLPADQRQNLLRNAVDVKIVFEESRVQSHQDFADCAKSKPIPPGMVVTFDIRNDRNRRTRDLVAAVPFLTHYVDATASNVNLSARSSMIWSMSAMRGFVEYIAEKAPTSQAALPIPGHPTAATTANVQAQLAEKTNGVEDYFKALIKHMPQLKTLDEARDPNALIPESPGTFRERLGGDLTMRGIGLSLFARGFVHCKTTGMSYEAMAKHLATVEWTLLDIERGTLPENDPAAFYQAVRDHVRPAWQPLVIIGENRFRVSSSSDDADRAWDAIKPHTPAAVAAE